MEPCTIEQHYLGSLLIALSKRETPDIRLRSEDFSDPTYGRIFETILTQLQDPAIPIPTILTLYRALPNLVEIIASLTNAALSGINLPYLETALLRESRKREFLRDVAAAQEQAQVPEADIDAIAARLFERLQGDPKTTRSRFADPLGYDQECIAYDPAKDFSLLNHLPCPDGTLSYIGARPGGGKTTMMINIARNALDQGRRAFFVNLEMSNKQILTNLILSRMYASAGSTLDSVDTPLTAYYCLFKPEHTAPLPFVNARAQARESLFSALGNRLFVYDGVGTTLSSIFMAIRSKTHQGDVVLIDYVQRLPVTPFAQRYLEIKAASNALLQLALRNSLVVIAGAQLNRKADDGEASLSDFREGGDIEADAHNALAIEREYLHVLKAREGKSGYRLGLEWKKHYCFMQITKKKEQPPGKAKPQRYAYE